jgi:hypothetical protein
VWLPSMASTLAPMSALARQIVEEKFAALVRHDLPVVTIALQRGGRMVDCFYGDSWHSAIAQ